MPGMTLDELHKLRTLDRLPNPTFIEEPEPRPREYGIVSVDDHLLEPVDLFTTRVPSRMVDDVPHVVTLEHGGLDGAMAWVIDGEAKPISMMNACMGRPRNEWNYGSVHYDDVRDGAYDIHARVRDMDIGGVWGSLGFPSIAWGFAGQRFSKMNDPAVGLACLRAFNDWVVEDWAGPYPERIIPCTVTWFLDIETAVAELYRNAERGVRAVSFSENPEMLGFPSLHTGYWDPYFAACEETGTVLNLHVGSASWTPIPSTDSPPEAASTLFSLTSAIALVDWLWSKIPLRFPDLRIVLSEGGIGWVPMVKDRLTYMGRLGESLSSWPRDGLSAAEVMMRSFRFTSYFDPTAFKVIEHIGADSIMVEVDYPHADSTWPDSQSVLREQLGHLDAETIRKVTHGNACELYRHPAPTSEWMSAVS